MAKHCVYLFSIHIKRSLLIMGAVLAPLLSLLASTANAANMAFEVKDISASCSENFITASQTDVEENLAEIRELISAYNITNKKFPSEEAYRIDGPVNDAFSWKNLLNPNIFWLTQDPLFTVDEGGVTAKVCRTEVPSELSDTITVSSVLDTTGNAIYDIVEIAFTDIYLSEQLNSFPDCAFIPAGSNDSGRQLFSGYLCRVEVAQEQFNYDKGGINYQAVLPEATRQFELLKITDKLRRVMDSQDEEEIILERRALSVAKEKNSAATSLSSSLVNIPIYPILFRDEYYSAGALKSTVCLTLDETKTLYNEINFHYQVCGSDTWSRHAQYALLVPVEAYNAGKIVQNQFHAAGIPFSVYEPFLQKIGDDSYLCHVQDIQGIYTRDEPNHCRLAISGVSINSSSNAVFTVAMQANLSPEGSSLIEAVKHVYAPCYAAQDGEVLIGNIIINDTGEFCSLPRASSDSAKTIVTPEKLIPVYFEKLQITNDSESENLVFSSLIYSRVSGLINNLEQKLLCKGRFSDGGTELWYWGYVKENACHVGSQSGLLKLPEYQIFDYNQSTGIDSVAANEKSNCVKIHDNRLAVNCEEDFLPRYYIDNSNIHVYHAETTIIEQLLADDRIKQENLNNVRFLTSIIGENPDNWEYRFDDYGSEYYNLRINNTHLCSYDASVIDHDINDMNAIIAELEKTGVDTGLGDIALTTSSKLLLRKAVRNRMLDAIKTMSVDVLEKLAKKGLIKVAERAAIEEGLAFIPGLGFIVDIALTAETLIELELMREEYVSTEEKVARLQLLTVQIEAETTRYIACLQDNLSEIINTHSQPDFDNGWTDTAATFIPWDESQIASLSSQLYPDNNVMTLAIRVPPGEEISDITARYDFDGSELLLQPSVIDYHMSEDGVYVILQVLLPNVFGDPNIEDIDISFTFQITQLGKRIISSLRGKFPVYFPPETEESDKCSI